MTITCIKAPVLVAGPRSNGRNFGIIAQSDEMSLRDGQISQITYINHNMIDQIGRVESVHFFIPIDDGSDYWFLGTCRSQPSISGNPVAITGGIILDRDQLDAINWRADLLIDNRFDPEPVFKTWLDPDARNARVDPVLYPIDHLASANRHFDHSQVAPLINVAAHRMVVIDSQVDATPAGQLRALEHIGGILAAAPFERAEELRWATAPVAEPLQWDLATAAAAVDGKFIEIRVSKTQVALQGASDSAWQIENEWLALLNHARAHFGSGADVAAMLDDHRRHPTLAARLAALLRYIHTQEATSPGNYAYWFNHLFVQFCAALPADERQPFHDAALKLPVPSASAMRPLLEGNAAAPLRTAGYGVAAIAHMAKPTDEPLALAGLLLEPELAQFEITDVDLSQGDADCATWLTLALSRGVEDPHFTALLNSATARATTEMPTIAQANWLLDVIPSVAANTGYPAEYRLRLQLDCENLLARLSPANQYSDKFNYQCQFERNSSNIVIRNEDLDSLNKRDFVFAIARGRT